MAVILLYLDSFKLAWLLGLSRLSKMSRHFQRKKFFAQKTKACCVFFVHSPLYNFLKNNLDNLDILDKPSNAAASSCPSNQIQLGQGWTATRPKNTPTWQSSLKRIEVCFGLGCSSASMRNTNMLSAVISGQIITEPKSGVSQTGTVWANCLVRVAVGQNREGEQESTLVQVGAFGEEAAKLARLTKGDAG